MSVQFSVLLKRKDSLSFACFNSFNPKLLGLYASGPRQKQSITVAAVYQRLHYQTGDRKGRADPGIVITFTIALSTHP